jgi:ribosomal peptide maturation radical SAM protein 1
VTHERSVSPSAAPATLRVCFVDMPFASSRRPSIQLGLLQAILSKEEVPATSAYLNLELGAALGWEPYEALCHSRDILLGEWLFARAAFGARAPDPEAFVRHYRPEIAAICEELHCDVAYLLDLRDRVFPAFVDDCIDRLNWSQFDIVGFSSIFEQNCAALALARRLKARFPTLITVFGGANFEDEMGLEYVRALPWVDYAVIGEGDEVFPQFLRRLATGQDVCALPGVASRAPDGTVRFAGRAPQVSVLDSLPEPDYSDYFDAAARLALPRVVRGQVISLPFESARGCWWGAKHHCTFCGLNGLGMAFRSKSSERFMSGIDELALRYGTYSFLSVDNILDQRYLRGVFEPLAQQRKDYTFFFEVKANLTHEQLKTLTRGGARILQPGIESLSTHLLELMRKGVTALQNVRFLKWGRYYDLVVTWNLLMGFPGERIEDYCQQARTIPLIHHLCPPGHVGRIRLDRFSPHFTDSANMGFHLIRPLRAYADIYPVDLHHESIAYSFSYESSATLPEDAYQELKTAALEWQRAWMGSGPPPLLVFQRGAGRLTITDTRPGERPRVSSFGELEARVYEAVTPTAHSASAVQRLLQHDYDDDTPLGSIEQVLNHFRDLELVLEEDGHYLGLALPVNPNW